MSVHPIEYRYFYPEMKRVWEEENRLQKWLDVEAALARAHAKLGNIPSKIAEEITKKSTLEFVKLERVKEIEGRIQHDLMAMVEALAEVCEGEAGKYVHLGATSYDIEDTALALQFKDAIMIVEQDLESLKQTLVILANNHKETICVGRTHGQHAVPTTYGMKFAVWANDVQLRLDSLKEVSQRLLVGKMTGAVGTAAGFGEKAEDIQNFVMEDLNLKPAEITTQVIQRDRHAEIVMEMALIASILDKIAKEIRNLQRTEIAELGEQFTVNQIGSSAMPHKRNPHKSERICSLARIVRALVIPALENIPLEHERDLTNSASERIIFPESFILVDYMLRQMNQILNKIELDHDNIKKNLEMTRGLMMTEHLMNGLVKKGVARQEAHEFLRKASAQVIKTGKILREVLLENGISKYFTEQELDWHLNPKNYIGTAVKQVDNLVKSLSK